MNPERVFGLLSESNPVPDLSTVPEALGLSSTRLHFVEPGRDLMQTDERDSIQLTKSTRDPNRRNRLLIGAATAVVALIVGLGTLAVIGGDKDAAVEPEVAVVLSAIEAQNRGDIEAYKASLTGAALDTEVVVHVAEALSYANSTLELIDCRVTGKAAAGESIVECDSTETDDFYGAGGIVISGTRRFLVTEDDKISSGEPPYQVANIAWEETELGMFNFAFFTWLMDAHPAVFEVIGPQRVVNSPAFASPANMSDIPGLNWPANRNFGMADLHEADEMLTALAYVDEFVAQSDVYPINQ